MIELNKNEIDSICGGFGQFFQAVVTGVSVFSAPALIYDKGQNYMGWGADLSQAYWDKHYPYDPNSPQCYGPYC